MAKKSRKALKPVERGFTTTSIPKKADRVNATNVSDLLDATVQNEKGIPEPPSKISDAASQTTYCNAESDVTQLFMEKYQEKVEREVLRNVKAIEYDRRLSKTYPAIKIDAGTSKCILDMISKPMDCVYQEENECGFDKLLNDTEDKLLQRLGITYGTLRRIGFSESRVDECLKNIVGVDIDEAIDWLYMNCSDEELYDEERSPNLLSTLPVSVLEKMLDIVESIDQQPLEDLPMLKTLNLGNELGENQESHAPLGNTYVPLAEEASSIDIFDDENSGDGVFNLLEPLPSEEVTVTGTTIRIRDMQLSKHYKGRTPKLLLKDLVLKTDKKARLDFKDTSKASRAKRASLTIRWGEKVQSWVMDDVACYDLIQAENYVATLAMHDLAFTRFPGFATATLGVGVGTAFRYLPTTYRTLWDELEDKRREKENLNNHQIWATLKYALSQKLIRIDKDLRKEKRGIPILMNVITRTPATQQEDFEFYEKSISAFKARQNDTAYQSMLIQRNTLPIAKYRDEIMEALGRSSVIVLSGETGCGKSTQVPAFILENHLSKGLPCKILCTEPRRISAISLAQRVSKELGEVPGMVGTSSSFVGYAIRLENRTSRNTLLSFVTNGVALKMLEGDSSSLDNLTHIIIDEVHERSIESDFLLLILKSLLEQRRSLRVILMSATVNAEKFASFFGACPIIRVPGRTFPVDVKFLEDSIDYCQWKIGEDSQYAKRESGEIYSQKTKIDWNEETGVTRFDEEEEFARGILKTDQHYTEGTMMTINLLDERLIPYELIVRLMEKLCSEEPSNFAYSAAILVFMPGLSEIRRLTDILLEHNVFGTSGFRIYPLHSMISSENQSAVFDLPPKGIRKIVIATNIAETGITIPDITCVIDTGKHREMRFDEKRQISRLVETFISRSNAMQRRGRAGRVRPGICFHLFRKDRHDTQMAEHPLPEMMRLSLSDLALRTKIMKINLGGTIGEVLSKTLDPPSPVNIQRAISALIEVKALTVDEEITPMGRLLSKLPTDVHIGKFLLIATLFRCLDSALTVAAALSTKSPFISPLGLERDADQAKSYFKIENSDFWTINNAFSSWRRISVNHGDVKSFCKQNFLSAQNLQQIEELRQQFLGFLVDASFINVNESVMREINGARTSRHRIKFVSVPHEYDISSANKYLLPNAALCAGLYPKILKIEHSKEGRQLRTLMNNQVVHIHPSSINHRATLSSFSVNHLCYFTIMHSKKLYAWEIGPIDDLAILILCGECEFKLSSNSAVVDHKIKFRLPPKINVALKILRNQLTKVFAARFRNEDLTTTEQNSFTSAIKILGKDASKDQDKPS